MLLVVIRVTISFLFEAIFVLSALGGQRIGEWAWNAVG